MAWEIEVTEEFQNWWSELDESEQDSVSTIVDLLELVGPTLSRPHADTVKGSKHANMKELRIQHAGNPYRVFFAFDPRRSAILLIGGNKAGNDRFYEVMIPLADKIYDEHLKALKAEEEGG